MEQLVLPFQTKSSNQTIDRLANRIPASAQFPIILRGCNSQSRSTSLENLELLQVRLDVNESLSLSNPLQHLAKNEVREPIRCRCNSRSSHLVSGLSAPRK